MGLQEAVGWSRYAQPHRQTWTADTPLRVIPNEPDRQAPAPTAVACSGVVRTETQSLRLRLVAGRPVRAVPPQGLPWVTGRWAAAGQTALLMVWAKAVWHVSQAVRAWLTAPNRRVKRDGGGGFLG